MPALASSASCGPALRCSGAAACSKARCLKPSLQRGALQLRRPAPPATTARRRLCRATTEKEGTQQQAGAPRVPDTPPTPTGASQQQQAAQAGSQQAEPSVSIEEIQQRAAAMRQEKAAAAATKEGLVEGVMEEVGLIKWPAPVKAVLNTLLVTGIVVGTAAALLAINSLLTELSDVLY